MDSLGQTNQPKKKVVPYKNDNIVEQIRSVGGSVGTAVKDTAVQVSSDVLNSLFGNMPVSGELKPNQNLEMPAAVPEKVVEVRVVTQTPEWMKRSQAASEQLKVSQELEAVRMQLKAIASSLKNLNTEIKAAVEQSPVVAGVYHLNFFEQLKAMLSILREQIEDSRSWLSLWTSRKKKKGYWGMLKKHGTAFGMSNERAIASAAG